MALGLTEYIDQLHDRRDLIWPSPAPPVPLKATPALQPLPGIRVVTFNVYGCLLQIDGGRLLHLHPQELRMQIALEKTIKEFNMWNSMSRKPGQPWEYMFRQYSDFVDEATMVATKRRGDVPEIDSVRVWTKILERLIKNEYVWDEGALGDVDQLAAKVAYFFHANLQGTQALPGAAATLQRMRQSGLRTGLIADAQSFTLPQLLFDLRQQSSVRAVSDVLSPECLTLSSQLGLRQPSPTLYRSAVERLEKVGVSPEQVLHVTHRLQDDLAAAKKCGFHTALLVQDKNAGSLQAADVRRPEWKPDRLLTQLDQVLEVLSV